MKNLLVINMSFLHTRKIIKPLVLYQWITNEETLIVNWPVQPLADLNKSR